MSGSVVYIDRFAIRDGKLAQLQKYAADIAPLAKDQAPGVVSFHCYVDDAGERVVR